MVDVTNALMTEAIAFWVMAEVIGPVEVMLVFLGKWLARW